MHRRKQIIKTKVSCRTCSGIRDDKERSETAHIPGSPWCQWSYGHAAGMTPSQECYVRSRGIVADIWHKRPDQERSYNSALLAEDDDLFKGSQCYLEFRS